MILYSWKQLESGEIEALVTGSMSELSFLAVDEFWSKVTMGLPVGCYTAITSETNLVFGLYMLRLMGSPGQPETGLA